MKRLLIVNAVTACLLALALALDGMITPAICLLLMTYSTIGAAYHLGKGTVK